MQPNWMLVSHVSQKAVIKISAGATDMRIHLRIHCERICVLAHSHGLLVGFNFYWRIGPRALVPLWLLVRNCFSSFLLHEPHHRAAKDRPNEFPQSTPARELKKASKTEVCSSQTNLESDSPSSLLICTH